MSNDRERCQQIADSVVAESRLSFHAPELTFDEILDALKNRVKLTKVLRGCGDSVTSHTKRIVDLALMLDRAELAESALRIQQFDQASKSPDGHLGHKGVE